MIDPQYKPILDALKEAGQVLKTKFKEILPTEQKSNLSDFRTEADVAAEKVILDAIQRNFPNYSIYAEESGHIVNDSDFEFVVDPMDGTSNFSLGIPNFTSTIGLHKAGKTIFAATYHPFADDVYHAYLGQGAFKNEHRIKASSEDSIQKSSISYSAGYGIPREWDGKMIATFSTSNVKRLATFWSPAYDFCLLASGRMDAVINCGNEYYDFIAGKFILKEAGAIITNFEGSEETDESSNWFIASANKQLHDEIVATLKKANLHPVKT